MKNHFGILTFNASLSYCKWELFILMKALQTQTCRKIEIQARPSLQIILGVPVEQITNEQTQIKRDIFSLTDKMHSLPNTSSLDFNIVPPQRAFDVQN